MSGRRDITAEVRCVQDRALAARERTRPPVAARLVALHTARLIAKRRRGQVAWGTVSGTLAIAAGVVLSLHSRPAASLSFTVDARSGAADTPIVAPVKPVSVQFSDGSAIELAPRSSMRVRAVESSGAEIVLEQGSAHTHVVPRAGNRWSIAAGPYRVQVTGTRFDTTWDPGTAHLRVTMQEGHVLVTGGCLEAARPLAAGETMEISCSPTSSSAPPLVVAPPREPSDPAPALSAVPSAWPHKSAALASARRALPAPSRPPAASDVTASASLSADDLMTTADGARRSGQRDVAEQAYRTVRTRYPGSVQAIRATFLLGRMLADGGRLSDAEALFVEYAHSSPNGTFAEEAAGRLFEIARVRGDVDLARSRARAYLDRFPSGASAEVARAMLER